MICFELSPLLSLGMRTTRRAPGFVLLLNRIRPPLHSHSLSHGFSQPPVLLFSAFLMWSHLPQLTPVFMFLLLPLA